MGVEGRRVTGVRRPAAKLFSLASGLSGGEEDAVGVGRVLNSPVTYGA